MNKATSQPHQRAHKTRKPLDGTAQPPEAENAPGAPPRSFHASIGRSKFDNRPARHDLASFQDLAKLIDATRTLYKGLAFICGTFSDGHRCKASSQDRAWLALDIDGASSQDMDLVLAQLPTFASCCWWQGVIMFDIYHSDRNDAWRYTLGKAGRRPLLTVGLNPSTATQEKSDPTVARVQKVAELHGFDGFVMLNLYPVRATDYRTLPTRVNAEAFERNLQVIEEVVAQHERPTIWAAWGAPVVHHGYFLRARDALVERLKPYRPAWRRLGELTAGGHPRHASRLNYGWKFEPLDFDQ